MYGKFKTRLDAFWHSYIPQIFFLKSFSIAKSFQFMNFSEAMVMFYENYLTSDFHTNTVISRRVCLLVKMASKTAIRPIVFSLPLVEKRNTELSFVHDNWSLF